MSGSLQLTLVNQSSDGNNSTVLVFQQNVIASLGEYAVAWQVIKNLGRGWSHQFEYEYDLTVGASDSYGNVSPLMTATPGQLFSVYRADSGDQIKGNGSVPNQTTEIWVENDLGKGAIDARIYRTGTLLATKTGIAPGQTASFQFNPSIYIGVVSQWDVKPGQVLNSAIMSAVNQQNLARGPDRQRHHRDGRRRAGALVDTVHVHAHARLILAAVRDGDPLRIPGAACRGRGRGRALTRDAQTRGTPPCLPKAPPSTGPRRPASIEAGT